MNKSTSGGLIQNTLLLIMSSFLTLVVAEAAFRLFSKATEADNLDAVRENTAIPGEGETVGLGHMVRLSDNPEIIYELIPNISVTHIGVPVMINASGFRGPMVEEEKPNGVKRIVGIGDSVMYGWGVNEDEAYLETLARKLNNEGEANRWEVINTAVPGYNTAMELQVLLDKGLRYKPDIVILGFVENDLSLPRFIRQPVDYLTIDRSFILDRIMPRPQKSSALNDTPVELWRGFGFRKIDMAAVPPTYRHMVGIESVQSSLATLKELGDEYHFEVILLVYRFFPKELRAAAKANGFHILNATRLWKKSKEAKGSGGRVDNFQLSESDPHPSAAVHQLIARGLYDLITTELITVRDVAE